MKHIYLIILLSISLLSATVTNTANLTIDSGVSVTVNGVFYNYGNIVNNGYLEVNGSYLGADDSMTGDGSFVVNTDEYNNADINADGLTDVLDLVLILNLILIDEYNEVGDVNGDGVLNILDIVIVINIILYNL